MSHRNFKDNEGVNESIFRGILFYCCFNDSGVCMYICHDVLCHVLEKLLMISFESSSEATAIRIR